MIKNGIRLIVSDIDNTILPEGKNDISIYTKETFEKAMQAGYLLFICTGRHYTLLPEQLMSHVMTDRIGTINGACVVDRNGKTMYKHTMQSTQTDLLTKFCIENQIGLGYKFEDRVVTYANHEMFVQKYLSDVKERHLIIDCSKDRNYHEVHGLPLGAFLIGEESRIQSFASKIPELTITWSCRNGYDVFLNDVNKSTAVEYILKENHLTWEEVIAFGDAGNDVAMLQKAKIGVATGNAKAYVKNVADMVCDKCEEDGVAKTIRELLL